MRVSRASSIERITQANIWPDDEALTVRPVERAREMIRGTERDGENREVMRRKTERWREQRLCAGRQRLGEQRGNVEEYKDVKNRGHVVEEREMERTERL